MPELLLVDDSPDLAIIVRLCCKPMGLSVTAVPDVPSAEAWLGSQREGPGPDLILLDVNLPGESGVELCRRLKAAPDFKRLRVALFVGASLVDDIASGWAAGADFLVAKDLVSEADGWRIRLEEILSGGDGLWPFWSLQCPPRRQGEPGTAEDRGSGILGSGRGSLREWLEGLNQTLHRLSRRLPGHAVLEAILDRAVKRVLSESSSSSSGPWLGHVQGQLMVGPGPIRIPAAALLTLLISLGNQAEGLLGAMASEPFHRELLGLAPASFRAGSPARGES
jgi:CheY-like chemotaxis protein